MKTFAFVIHPVTVEQLRKHWFLSRLMPRGTLKSLLKNLPPFKLSRIKGLRSPQGEEIQGYFIGCPLLPEQMLELDEKFVLDKIIACGQIAEQLGAQILGLGGYTSIVADKGYTVARRLKIPVTSGNAYTAWSVFEAVYRAAKVKNVNLKQATLAVIGATGSIGSLCTKKLAEYVGRIIITARHRDKLEQLKETLLHLAPIEVIIQEDVHQAAKEADILVITTSTPEALLSVEELKPNAIACDVSLPKNINHRLNSRRDIALIDSGLIKLPYPAKFGINIGLPKNIVYACMAETMLLTFEGKFTSYSLGDNINPDKMEEIANIAARHGFEVWVPQAPLQ